MITLFLIILFIFVIFILTNKIEKFTDYSSSNIYFLDYNESVYILKYNNDNYFKSFYKLDYVSRNINNIEEYFNMIDKSIENFTYEEKDKIYKCIEIANNRIKNISLEWFDGKKCLNIPWNIICVKGKLYENGLPHTRGNYIIISKKDINDFSIEKLTKTLIHEKVHIYQKIYKEDAEKYLIKHNFTKYKYRTNNDKIRSNPDIDNWIYKDENGNIYSAKYVNDNPTSIENIEYKPYNSQSYEHPFEKMAIYIENYI